MRLTGDGLVGPAIGAPLFVAAAAAPFYLDGATFAVGLVILAAIVPVEVARNRHRIPPTEPGPTRHRPTEPGPTRYRIPPTEPGPTRHRIRPTDPAPLTRRRRPSPVRALRRNLADARRYLRGRAVLRVLVLAVASLAFFEAMVFAILVLFALGPLHVSRSWFGVFVAAGAVGAAIGLLSGRLDRGSSHAASLVLGTAGVGLAYLLLAPSPSAPLAAGALLLHGCAATVATRAARSLREELVPEAMGERINSAFRMVVFASVPVGAIAGGAVAAAWSLRGAVLAAGLGQMIVVIVLAGPVLHRLGQPVIDLRSDELDPGDNGPTTRRHRGAILGGR